MGRTMCTLGKNLQSLSLPIKTINDSNYAQAPLLKTTLTFLFEHGEVELVPN